MPDSSILLTLLSWLAYPLAFLFVLGIVIAVHEYGHFQAARSLGIKVAVFSFGFGKEIIGRTDRHGTRWQLSMIPLGGYVRFADDADPTSTLPAEPAKGQFEAGAFHTAPVWKRAIVVFAGPFANFVLAILVFALLFATLGRSYAPAAVGGVEPGGPAAIAGLQAGDKIVSISGSTVHDFNDLRSMVMVRSGETLSFVIEREGQQIPLAVTLGARERTGLGGRTMTEGFLGVNSPAMVRERLGPIEAVFAAGVQTRRVIEGTGVYLSRLLTGRDDASQLSGPLGTARMAGDVAKAGAGPADLEGVSFWDRVAGVLLNLVQLAAFLSISVGIFNLLPLPVLDGGHLLFYAIEAIRGKPLPAGVQTVSYQLSLVVVGLLFVFVTFNDLALH